MSIVLAVCVLILFILYIQLRNRVEKLEDELRSKTDTPRSHSQSAAASAAFTAAQPAHESPTPVTPTVRDTVTTQPPPPTISYVEPAPAEPSLIFTWFQEQPLIKLGALFFFLGMAWFLGYAINEGWIDPALRILIAIAIGIGISALGHWRRTTSPTQYLTLTALGSAVIFASVAAGQFTLELLPPTVALLLLVISIGYTIWVAVQTRTEWLAVIATLATVIAPLLVNSPAPDLHALLIYLFVASVSLMSVVALTQWRGVTFVLTISSGLYLVSIHNAGTLADLVVWLFVLLFAGLYFIGSSYSVLRTQEVRVLDIAALSTVGLWYLLLAHELAFSPGIATLVAAFTLASTGYLAQTRQLPATVVALFTVFATIALLFGTAFLFSGVTLVLVFALEITVALTLACTLRFSNRIILLVSCLYVLPIFLSLPYLSDSQWTTGIFHLSAFTLLAVWISLLWGTHTVLRRDRSQHTPTELTLGGILLTVSYIYGALVIFAFGDGLGVIFNSPGVISTYVLLMCVTVLFVTYTVTTHLPLSWTTAGLITSGLPLLFSFTSLDISYWQENGVLHTHSLGIVLLLLLLGLLVGVLLLSYRDTNLAYYRTATIAVVGVGILYLLIVIQAFWHGIFSAEKSLAHVAIYTTYAVLVYSVITLAVQHRATPAALTGLSSLGALPLLMALPSFTTSAWENSVLHPDAAGLYALVTLIVLTGITIYQYSQRTSLTNELLPLCRILFTTAGLLSIGLIWIMAGAMTPTEAGGITVALFIYTVVGLYCYLLGRARNHEAWRWAGIALIALVTLRLVIVDIWVMEVFWRIITFLGIGSLFIAAALLERHHPPTGHTNENG